MNKAHSYVKDKVQLDFLYIVVTAAGTQDDTKGLLVSPNVSSYKL